MKKKTRRRPPDGKKDGVPDESTPPKPETNAPHVTPSPEFRQVPGQMTDEELGEFARKLYREALTEPSGRQCINELKALGRFLGPDFMCEAAYVSGAIHALMAARHRSRYGDRIGPNGENYDDGSLLT